MKTIFLANKLLSPIVITNNNFVYFQNIITDLKSKESIALNLEKTIQNLPPDEETDTLLNDLTEIKEKILLLLSQANLGQEQVLNAQGTLKRQQSEIKKFDGVLYNLERWIENAKPILLREVDGSDISRIEMLIQAHEVRNFKLNLECLEN